jgi:tetratricopeptide (TPR) repeat protein
MWHWHLPRKSFLYPTAGLALTISCSFALPALAADSSVGPVSEAEGVILWKESQTDYSRENCQDALNPLKRLVDRYPGYPTASDYRKARFELGHCYFELKKDKEAVRTLKTYLEGSGEHPDSDQARELLGRAQLRLKQFHEADLTSQELQKSEAPEAQAKALLLRSQVWIARDQNEKAKASVISALSLAESLKSKPLLGEARATEYEIMTRECLRSSSTQRHKKGKALLKDEAHVRSEIETRGTCLTEALVQFRKVLGTEHEPSAERALTLAKNSFADYRQACENPPQPPALKPRDRTADQLRKYRNELVDNLSQIYENHRKTAVQMIVNWKQETPPPSQAVQRRLQVLENLLKEESLK